MSDISALIQEAKPLYFKRKKRRQQFKIVTGVVGCLMVSLLLIGMPTRINRSTVDMGEFYTYLYDDSSYQMLVGVNEAVNADDWFTDEYLI